MATNVHRGDASDPSTTSEIAKLIRNFDTASTGDNKVPSYRNANTLPRISSIPSESPKELPPAGFNGITISRLTPPQVSKKPPKLPPKPSRIGGIKQNLLSPLSGDSSRETKDSNMNLIEISNDARTGVTKNNLTGNSIENLESRIKSKQRLKVESITNNKMPPMIPQKPTRINDIKEKLLSPKSSGNHAETKEREITIQNSICTGALATRIVKSSGNQKLENKSSRPLEVDSEIKSSANSNSPEKLHRKSENATNFVRKDCENFHRLDNQNSNREIGDAPQSMEENIETLLEAKTTELLTRFPQLSQIRSKKARRPVIARKPSFLKRSKLDAGTANQNPDQPNLHTNGDTVGENVNQSSLPNQEESYGTGYRFETVRVSFDDQSGPSNENKEVIFGTRTFVEYLGPDLGYDYNVEVVRLSSTLEYPKENEDESNDWDSDSWSSDSGFSIESETGGQTSPPPDPLRNQPGLPIENKEAYGAAEELVKTEESYVEQLRLLDQVFRHTVEVENSSRSFISNQEFNGLFSNLGSIYKLNSLHILPSLQQNLATWSENQQICGVFSKNAPFLKIYSEYASNCENAAKLFAKLYANNEKFASIVDSIQNSENCNNLPLESLLICPIYRLERYKHLLQEYLKNLPPNHRDRKYCERSVELVVEAMDASEMKMNKDFLRNIKEQIGTSRNVGESSHPNEPTEKDCAVTSYIKDNLSANNQNQNELISCDSLDESQVEISNDKKHQLLEKEPLTKQRDKSYKAFCAADELVTTEKSYVDKLHLLDQNFRRFIVLENDSHNFISKKEINALFGNLESLYKFHSEYLLPALQKSLSTWSETQKICNVFIKNAPYLKIYSEYIYNYDKAMGVFADLYRKNKKFVSIVNSIQADKNCDNLRLDNHFICPVQRVMRYRLLLQEYLKHLPPTHHDREDCEKSIELATEATNHANDLMNKLDKYKDVLAIQEQLDSIINLVTPSRRLVRSGELTRIFSENNDRCLREMFLFNDVLLVCSRHVMSTGIKQLKPRHLLPLENMKILEGDNLEIEHSFYIKTEEKLLEFFAKSVDEKLRWQLAFWEALKEFEQSQSSLRLRGHDSSKGEITCEAAVKQTSATVCTVCKVVFKQDKDKLRCGRCNIFLCKKCRSEKIFNEDGSQLLRVCKECNLNVTEDRRITSLFATLGRGKVRPSSTPLSPSGIYKEGRPSRMPTYVQRTKSLLNACPDDNSLLAEYLLLQVGKDRVWERRYFVIQKDYILYAFKSNKNSFVTTSQPLPGCLAATCCPKTDPGIKADDLVFKIVTPRSRCYYLKAQTKESLVQWISLINLVSIAKLPSEQEFLDRTV